METVKAECSSCGGTGLYCGFAEKKGLAVVCRTCSGTGCKEISYTLFTGRKPKADIHTVSLSRGSFIGTGVGAHGVSIGYHAFQKGAMPG